MIWGWVYKLGVDVFKAWKPYAFPPPTEVWDTTVLLVKEGTLWVAVTSSMQRLLLGYGISLVLGVAIGLIIVQFKYLDENFSSLILGLQTLPSICWLPFSILWFGLSEKAILFVVAIGSTFAIAMATESGIKNVDPLYLKAAKTMGAKGFKLYWNVVFPACLPTLMDGLKQGWSFAWRALMAGEMLYASKGLGQVLTMGRELADMSQVMALMLVIIVLGVGFDKLLFGKVQNNMRRRWGLQR